MPSAAATFALDPAVHEAMIAARRHLHAHPELSNAEEKTEAYVRTWLEAQGWGEAKAAAGAGAFIDIVGVGGSSDRKIAIRADIDELPIFEQSGEPFASRNPGVMHACGHDAHTAMGLATAALLHRHRAEASDIFDVVIRGRSAHAAKPHEGVDAIAIGAAIVSELQKIVAGN
jgi:metal-dependent amidase/aminoacylase/carboxypeptidase family protein